VIETKTGQSWDGEKSSRLAKGNLKPG